MLVAFGTKQRSCIRIAETINNSRKSFDRYRIVSRVSRLNHLKDRSNVWNGTAKQEAKRNNNKRYKVTERNRRIDRSRNRSRVCGLRRGSFHNRANARSLSEAESRSITAPLDLAAPTGRLVDAHGPRMRQIMQERGSRLPRKVRGAALVILRSSDRRRVTATDVGDHAH